MFICWPISCVEGRVTAFIHDILFNKDNIKLITFKKMQELSQETKNLFFWGTKFIIHFCTRYNFNNKMADAAIVVVQKAKVKICLHLVAAEAASVFYWLACSTNQCTRSSLGEQALKKSLKMASKELWSFSVPAVIKKKDIKGSFSFYIIFISVILFPCIFASAEIGIKLRSFSSTSSCSFKPVAFDRSRDVTATFCCLLLNSASRWNFVFKHFIILVILIFTFCTASLWTCTKTDRHS